MADIGRPSDYTPDLAARICARMSEGESMRSICRDPDMPCLASVFLWLSKYPEFSEQYDKAYAERADAMFEEIFEIADDGTNDWMERQNKDGSTFEAFNAEHVQRSRLRVDTRKWALARMSPRKYGEKVTNELTGPNGTDLGITVQFVTQTAKGGDK
jgi:hypothetical protein